MGPRYRPTAARLEAGPPSSYTGSIGSHCFDDETHSPDSVRISSRRARRAGVAAQVLMAAMVGLREGLGFERPSEQTIVLAPNLTTGDLPLGFGPLPPID